MKNPLESIVGSLFGILSQHSDQIWEYENKETLLNDRVVLKWQLSTTETHLIQNMSSKTTTTTTTTTISSSSQLHY